MKENVLMIQEMTRADFISLINGVFQDKIALFLKTKKPENFTVKQVAEHLNCSTLTVHNYIRKGMFPAKKIGGKLIINRIDLENALEEVKSFRYKRKGGQR